ncbi:zinc finger MYM-type protein 1-like [Anneissia japonica]|uniref:zinc finger MYM-type protein 1-like n=1 Tax=Anneissia japonica TaxID=1529436 RepID=UPI0014255536|nr:zinc finger MYM-type protein 1-like [Anneissia japonica]
MSDIVLKELKKEVKEAGFFVIIADDTKDTSKKEQVVIAIRYCLHGGIHEEFIGVEEAGGLDALGLKRTILNQLGKFGVSLDNCVGPGYDGASVVSGHLSGLQALIRDINPRAYYVHCFAHRLNLVLVDASKSVSVLSKVIRVYRSRYNFITSNVVHKKWVEHQTQQELTIMEFGRLSDTRWSCSARQINMIGLRLPTLINVLKDVASIDMNAQRRTDAKGFLSQLDAAFIRNIHLLATVPSVCKFASDMLQSKTNDLGRAMGLIKSNARCKNQK